MKSHLIAAAVLATGISSSAFAAVVYSESFDAMTVGAINGQDGWVAANNGPTVVAGLAYSNTAGSYSYTNSNAVNGVRSNTGQNIYAYDNTPSVSLPQATTYFSFLVNAPNAPSGTPEAQALRLFSTSSNGAGFGVRLNTGTTGDIVMTASIGNTTGGSSPSNSVVPNSKNLTAGATHLIVGKIEFDVNGADDRLSLWAFGSGDAMDPSTFTTGQVAYEVASVIGSERTSALKNTVAVGRTNATNYQIVVDEIRIGTELGDVITIPEPASLGLLGLSGLALGRRRRVG